MHRSDEELYRVYLAEGSEDALRELLVRYRESLTLFIYGYVRNMDDAEELMLDAFAAAVPRAKASQSFRMETESSVDPPSITMCSIDTSGEEVWSKTLRRAAFRKRP